MAGFRSWASDKARVVKAWYFTALCYRSPPWSLAFPTPSHFDSLCMIMDGLHNHHSYHTWPLGSSEPYRLRPCLYSWRAMAFWKLVVQEGCFSDPQQCSHPLFYCASLRIRKSCKILQVMSEVGGGVE